MGRIYVKTHRYKDAVAAFEEKLPFAPDNSVERAWLLHDLGRCFLELKQYERAAELGEVSLQVSDALEDRRWGLNGRVLVAQAQAQLKQHKLAIESYASALALADALGDEPASHAIGKVLADLRRQHVEDAAGPAVGVSAVSGLDELLGADGELDDAGVGSSSSASALTVAGSGGGVVAMQPNMGALIAETQSVAQYVGALTSEAPTALSASSSVPALIDQINGAFERQHAINQAQHMLTSRNYMMGVYNFAKNVQLQRARSKALVRKGTKEIAHLNGVIVTLRQELTSLNLDVEEQRLESIRISRELEQTQALLDHTIAEHDRELATHRNMIESQGSMLHRLVRQRARQDLMMDGAIALVALVISRTRLVKDTIGMMVNTTMRPSARRTRFRQLLNVLAFVAILVRLRELLIAMGLHSSTASLWQTIAALVVPGAAGDQGAQAAVPGGAAPAVAKSSASSAPSTRPPMPPMPPAVRKMRSAQLLPPGAAPARPAAAAAAPTAPARAAELTALAGETLAEAAQSIQSALVAAAQPLRPLLSSPASTYGALPPTSARAAYQPLSDGVFKQEVQVDEDLSFVAAGRIATPLSTAVYRLLCILSGGAFYLLCRWNIRLEVLTRTRRCPMHQATHVHIVNHWGEQSLEPVRSAAFAGRLSDAFPQLFDTSTPGIHPPIDTPLASLDFFEYRYFKFILEPISARFVPNYIWRDPRWQSVAYVVSHRDSDSGLARKHTIFGLNAVDIQEKSTLRLLVDEVLHPFFVFQIASIILWSLDSYYYYATCIFIISTTSAIATLIETKTTLRRIRELSKFTCQVRYWRNGAWSYGRSEELVPGDLVELESGLVPIVPCDAILLQGDCIVNESMLTGESLPVSKSPATDVDLASIDFEEEEPSSSSRMSRFFLFSGTEIIRVRAGSKLPPLLTPSATPVTAPPPLPTPSAYISNAEQAFASDDNASSSHESVGHTPLDPLVSPRGAIALVVRTGFNTTKGSLVRSILFPRPNKFKFYQDSFRFIGVLALISCLGFLASLYFFIQLGMSWGTILVRALDLITIVVPPALPATLAIGTSFAISRLRQGDIFCTSPPRVNICGKINVMCFDKTGTLTQEGLDVLGIRFTVPRTSKTDTPTSDDATLRTPLRFSRLYRNIDALMPRSVVNHQIDFSAKPTGPISPRGSLSATHSSLGNLSGASIFLAREGGHPNAESDYPYPLIICAMATCHSIKVVHGSLVGDPLDLRMFDFTGWNLEEDVGAQAMANTSFSRRRSSRHASSMVVRPPWAPDFDTVVNGARNGMRFSHDEVFTELGVVRAFEFVSSLRRMSVIVRRMRYSHNMFTAAAYDPLGGGTPFASRDLEVFVKGAPEAIRLICAPESLPVDFDDQLRDYTHHGYRVIACAWRKLDGVSWSAAMKMKRHTVESDLQFLGFIVFENKLKSGTTPVVQTLYNARIRQIMCTGDSLLTSISVSRECGLVDPARKVFVPRFVEGEAHEETAKIVWEDVDGSGAMLDNATLKPLSVAPTAPHSPTPAPATIAIPRFFRARSTASQESPCNYELAITGDVFQWMLDFAPDETFERMLIKCQVFSRMSPDQKHFLVENLQRLGYCVGFCGDGTNDCGALKAADTGLSLSEAEASVAAPFTSKSKDLDCVLRIIREGRVALVTSFSCFKYMALYSLIQFTSVSLLYSLGQNIGDFQFMYIDLALIIPIAVFMGRTGPHPSIDRKRPTASLVSKKVLTSLVGQVVLQVAFQFAVFFWVRLQPWYHEGRGDMDNQEYESFENTAIFLVSCFQYIIVAVVFTVGPPYQEPVWKNIPYVSTLLFLTVLTLFISLAPTEWMISTLGLLPMPFEGRVFVVGLSAVNFVLSWLLERWVFPHLARFGARALDFVSFKVSRDSSGVSGADETLREIKRRKWRQRGKLYKIIEQEFESFAALKLMPLEGYPIAFMTLCALTFGAVVVINKMLYDPDVRVRFGRKDRSWSERLEAFERTGSPAAARR
ncbi:hypothetical protein HK105_205150 [Polyrhizophydium stewartii]|uniref:Cation-transporting ATPase n=1 Tax=Polyrhizophydium stewartii TaxID=2732419 RepID=A0ABR4N710_9FUNG